MNVALLPCLKTPLKRDRSGVGSQPVDQDENVDQSSTENDFRLDKIKVDSYQGDMVDFGSMEEADEVIPENIDNTEGVSGSCKLPELEGLQEEWILAKKGGKK